MTELTARSNFDSVVKGDVVQLVGVVEGALAEEQQFATLAALLPNVQFEIVGPNWLDRSVETPSLLIVGADASAPPEIEALVRHLGAAASQLTVVVLLRQPDIATTRMLIRAGAADVIPAPANETSLAVALDKLLGSASETARGSGPRGQIVAVLKAGGGVGATALAVQTAVIAARRGVNVCLADLDLQFGAAGIYLDLPNAATVSDCMAAGAGVKDVDFSSLLARHASGLRLLAAPRQVTPLDALAPQHAEALLDALRRNFELSIVDLPSVWTAWTNRVLQMADRIVVVTHLTVPHMHMLDRQFATLRAQGLNERPVTLVCNGLCSEQTAILPLKSAERVLGNRFDVIVPEDRKLMYGAISQGVEISAIRKSSKIEKAIGQLVSLVAPQAAGEPVKARWGQLS